MADDATEHEVLVISRNQGLQRRGVSLLGQGLSELDVAARSGQT